MEKAIVREYRQLVTEMARRWRPQIELFFRRGAPTVDIAIIREFVKRNPTAFILGLMVDPDYLTKCVDQLNEWYGCNPLSSRPVSLTEEEQ